MNNGAPALTVLQGTVVFTDIVGFTEYTALRGDEEAFELLSAQERLVRDALPRDARIVKELGDGLFLWFADACQAVETSLSLQERFEHQAMEHQLPLWVRMGLHSGHQLRRGDDLVGHDVNVASRVVGAAGPGEVVLSDATCAQVRDKLTSLCFEELGPVVMKGLPEPVPLFRAQRSAEA